MSRSGTARVAMMTAMMVFLPGAALAQPSATRLVLSAAQRHDAGVKVRALPLVRYTPTRLVPGIVRNVAPILALRAALVQQMAQAGLAREQARRAEALYRAGHNIAQAQLQRAQAAQDVAVARLDALRAQAMAGYGRALGADIVGDQARGATVLTALAHGAPLIELVFDGQHAADGTAAGWTRIGKAGVMQAGLIGVPVYFYGMANHALPAGTSVRLAVQTRRVQLGYQVPASALIYRRGRVLIFVQHAQTGQFRPVTLAVGGGAIIRRQGRLQSLFVPQTALAADPRVVTQGAGLLRSLMVREAGR